MNKEKKKAKFELVYSIVGIAVSVALLIIGIFAWCDAGSIGYLRQGLRFGADFYTEMYDVTESVMINVANVGNAVYSVCELIGSVLTVVSVLMLVFYIKKMIFCIIDLGGEKKAETEAVTEPVAEMSNYSSSNQYYAPEVSEQNSENTLQ